MNNEAIDTRDATPEAKLPFFQTMGGLSSLTFLAVGFAFGFPVGVDFELLASRLADVVNATGWFALCGAGLALIAVKVSVASRRAARFLLSVAVLMALLPTLILGAAITTESDWGRLFLMLGHYSFLVAMAHQYSRSAIPYRGEVGLLLPLRVRSRDGGE